MPSLLVALPLSTLPSLELPPAAGLSGTVLGTVEGVSYSLDSTEFETWLDWGAGDEDIGHAWASIDEAEPLDHRPGVRSAGRDRVDPNDRLLHVVFPRVESGSPIVSGEGAGGDLRSGIREVVEDGRDKGVGFLSCPRISS
jgi:hypothetical protein